MPGDVAQRRALAAALDAAAAGSPSKSSTTQSSPVQSWPRWWSPCWRISRPVEPTWARQRAVIAQLLAAARDRLQRTPSSGSSLKSCLDLVVDRRAQERQRLEPGSSGAKAGSSGSRRARGACPRSPRRAARAGRNRSGRVGERVERELPAVDARRPRIAAQPERGVDRGARLALPAGERGRCSRSRARSRKRSISSSGFTPGSRRRKTLRISASSRTTEELDCSEPSGAAAELRARAAQAAGRAELVALPASRQRQPGRIALRSRGPSRIAERRRAAVASASSRS